MQNPEDNVRSEVRSMVTQGMPWDRACDVLIGSYEENMKELEERGQKLIDDLKLRSCPTNTFALG